MGSLLNKWKTLSLENSIKRRETRPLNRRSKNNLKLNLRRRRKQPRRKRRLSQSHPKYLSRRTSCRMLISLGIWTLKRLQLRKRGRRKLNQIILCTRSSRPTRHKYSQRGWLRISSWRSKKIWISPSLSLTKYALRASLTIQIVALWMYACKVCLHHPHFSICWLLLDLIKKLCKN